MLQKRTTYRAFSSSMEDIMSTFRTDSIHTQQQNRFGEWLFQARTARGWTQVEVVEQMETLLDAGRYRRDLRPNPELVSRWEHGQQKPIRLYRLLLCQLFKISERELISLLYTEITSS
jgi:transcriptional regulator with XRE-family HTH domain